MIKSRESIKVFLVNSILIFFVLFGPATAYYFARFVRGPKPRASASYPTFENKKISREIFLELDRVAASYKYYSFIGWRKQLVNLKYTNVDPPYNTRRSIGQGLNKSYWFFGGSTMWGNGVSDINTIPSHFYKISGKSVYNFGEGGWGSRQSLNQLISIISHKQLPQTVVFYDGVNDVQHQCRTEIVDLPSHSYQTLIRSSLKIRKSISSKFSALISQLMQKSIFLPYKKVLNKVLNIDTDPINTGYYNCVGNPERAKSIAKNLVENWYSAYALSKIYSFKFLAVLQPTIYTSMHDYSYFSESDKKKTNLLKDEYNYVYPYIYEFAKEKCLFDKTFCDSFVDGRQWLKESVQPIFFDFNHLNSNGNKLVARKIYDLLILRQGRL